MRNDNAYGMDNVYLKNIRGRATILDALIGMQIQKARLEKEFNLSQLGNALDLTYQQIQKYEAGENRIAASTLLLCSLSLNTPIDFFFSTAREKLME